MTETILRIETADGETLEAIAGLPPDEPGAVIVICHPHPEYGGTMNAPVLDAIARTATERGVAALRFNFRGVGASTGRFEGGVGEVADVAAAVHWARSEYPGVPLVVCGWSFGAAVSLRWMIEHRRSPAWIGLAPAFGFGSELELDATGPAPKLVIAGERDQLIPLESTEAAVAELAGDVRLVTLPGCDHFFVGGFADQAAEYVGEFVADRIEDATG